MKVIPYYIFYIVILAVLPISIIPLWVVLDANAMGVLIAPFLAGVSAIPRSGKEYERMGYENAFRAHRVLTIIGETWKLLSIVLFGIYGIQLLIVFTIQPTYFADIPQSRIIPVMSFVSLFSYVITYAVHTAWNKNREFRLFMSRENCKIASGELDRMKRVKHLLESLSWYEQYVKTALKLKMANIDEVSSRFLTQGSCEQGQTISQFYKAFASGDELEPLNLIGSVADSTDGRKVLVRENTGSKWKDWKIPIIVGIMGVIGQFGSVVLQSLLK